MSYYLSKPLAELLESWDKHPPSLDTRVQILIELFTTYHRLVIMEMAEEIKRREKKRRES